MAMEIRSEQIDGESTYCRLMESAPTRRNNARNGVSSIESAIALTSGTIYECEVCMSRSVTRVRSVYEEWYSTVEADEHTFSRCP